MNYYKRHKKAINTFYANLEQLSHEHAENKTWIVFGSSRISGMIISYLKVKGIQVSYIIDNAPSSQNKTAFGVPIYKPENLLQPKKADVLILVASAYQDAMFRQLEDMGYTYGTDMVKVIDLPELMSDFSFEDRSRHKKMPMDKVREYQLGILNHLKAVCQKHNLEYFIIAGTLLGAVRHQGYIPWDDDVDVIMDVRDIRKLSEILKTDSRYKLISMFDEELDYFDGCSLMVDTETVMDLNRFPMQSTTGISIDIFTLTGVPDGEEGIAYIAEARDLETNCYNSLYSPEECRKNIHKLIECLTRYDIAASPQAGDVLGRNFYLDIFDSSVVGKHIEMPFENLSVWAPVGYDHYLTRVFGDYMKLPPKEQRVPHHFFNAFWKLEENPLS